jgi:hypothetical protein
MCMKCKSDCVCPVRIPPTVDWNKPIQTKDGVPCKFLGVRKDVVGFTHVILRCESRTDGIFVTDSSGYGGPFHTVINVPERKVRLKLYLNVYDANTSSGRWTKKREDAVRHSATNAETRGCMFYSSELYDESWAKEAGYEYEVVE